MLSFVVFIVDMTILEEVFFSHKLIFLKKDKMSSRDCIRPCLKKQNKVRGVILGKCSSWHVIWCLQTLVYKSPSWISKMAQRVRHLPTDLMAWDPHGRGTGPIPATCALTSITAPCCTCVPKIGVEKDSFMSAVYSPLEIAER